MSFTCKNRSTVFSTRLFTHLKKQRKHPSILTSPGKVEFFCRHIIIEDLRLSTPLSLTKCLTYLLMVFERGVHMLSHFQGKSVRVSFSSEQGLQCPLLPQISCFEVFYVKSSPLVTSRLGGHWKLSGSNLRGWEKRAIFHRHILRDWNNAP